MTGLRAHGTFTCELTVTSGIDLVTIHEPHYTHWLHFQSQHSHLHGKVLHQTRGVSRLWDFHASTAMGTCCRATADIRNLLAVNGHVFVSRNTSLSEFDVAVRSLARPLCCGVAVTVIGLCANGVLRGKGKSIVHDHCTESSLARVPEHGPTLDLRVNGTKRFTVWLVAPDLAVQHKPGHFTQNLMLHIIVTVVTIIKRRKRQSCNAALQIANSQKPKPKLRTKSTARFCGNRIGQSLGEHLKPPGKKHYGIPRIDRI